MYGMSHQMLSSEVYIFRVHVITSMNTTLIDFLVFGTAGDVWLSESPVCGICREEQHCHEAHVPPAVGPQL